MLVLSSVANREAHPSPRFCVWDLHSLISHPLSGLSMDSHHTQWMHKLVGETLMVSNFNSSSCLCFLGLMFLYLRFTNLVKDVDPIWGCLVRVDEPSTVSHYKDTLLASVSYIGRDALESLIYNLSIIICLGKKFQQ